MKEIKTKYVDTDVTCACGNKFIVKSVKKELHVETCNECHPQYTGKQTATRQTGAVEKFKAKMEKLNKEAA